MAKADPSNESRIHALLKGAFGDFDPKQTLASLFDKTPALGRFEWMLTILAIEIDLRVDIPERLSDNRKSTVRGFMEKVLKLPKVETPTYTLDSLVLLAQALLALDTDEEATHGGSEGRLPKTAKKAPKRSPKTAPKARGK